MNFDLSNLGDLRKGSGNFSKEKYEVWLGFVVKIFTKSLHRGGVCWNAELEMASFVAIDFHIQTVCLSVFTLVMYFISLLK